MYHAGFTIRLYPNKHQEALIWKHIYSCKFIWNYMIFKQNEIYEKEKGYLDAYDMINLITDLKKELPWLCEVSRHSLNRRCVDVHNAYIRYFNKISGHPKPKHKKKFKPSYPVRVDDFYFKDNKVLNIAKLGKVKYKTDKYYLFPKGKKSCKCYNIRLSYIDGKYMLSFTMEIEKQGTPKLNDFVIGIDLGIRKLATIAINPKVDGTLANVYKSKAYPNINKSKRMRYLNKKLKHTQRALSRKVRMSMQRNNGVYVETNNIRKDIIKIRKIYKKIANIRKNYIHQVTSEIISYRPKRIIMESINILELVKIPYMSRAIYDMCWGEFIRQMKYKCEWNDIEFIQANRSYPSTKMCCKCGTINNRLSTHKTYVCKECGLKLDRDINAAINLSRYKV